MVVLSYSTANVRNMSPGVVGSARIQQHRCLKKVTPNFKDDSEQGFENRSDTDMV